jgi:PAS domain S-box-containing protein
MLMVMNISHDDAPEPAAQGGSPPSADGQGRPTDAVTAMVESSSVPLAAVDLPSGRILAVNPALADAMGSTVDALAGSSSLDWLAPDDRNAGRLGFEALADGNLTGYQTLRKLANPKYPDQVFSIWVSAVEVEGDRVGFTSLIPADDHDNEFRALPPVSKAPEPGHVVLGTVDGAWRIDRISQDVVPMLGLTPEQCTRQSVLSVIYPSDLPAFLAAVEHARRGERAVRLTLRVTTRPEDVIEITVVLATTSPGEPPPLAFALIRDDGAADPSGPGDSTREMQLEAHMLRIADELHAAGVIPRLSQLPALTDKPQLGKLTSREWVVLTRLLDGQRISGIASDLFVSQSTVRNHLSSIYAKLGVRSQTDLIRLLRHRTMPPAED